MRMARLPGDTDGRRFLRAMARFGWVVESQRGGHRKLVRQSRVVARRVLREAGIDEDAFARSL